MRSFTLIHEDKHIGMRMNESDELIPTGLANHVQQTIL